MTSSSTVNGAVTSSDSSFQGLDPFNGFLEAETSSTSINDGFSDINTPKQYPMAQKVVQVPDSFSNITVTVKLDEPSSELEGNLTIDYKNNDPINISRIPFHLYPSGMANVSRQGKIDVLSVTDSLSANLPFNVLTDQQLMWVNLTTQVEPNMSVTINMKFKTTLPDGFDRSNSNGFDSNQSRIYTSTGFYPIPCVYDEYDGWNTDPYINVSDPFYFDMANYELTVIVPEGMIVAATGALTDQTKQGTHVSYDFKSNFPVREVVFSASRYFIVESTMANGVNVSSYYLPHSSALWMDNALDAAVNSLSLFDDVFGTYPYSTYNLVEAYGFYSGMEYPSQVQISVGIKGSHPDDPGFWLELTIAHETAHQWWSQIVGNDQIDYGHLDEGLTSWSTDYYFDYYNPDWNYFGDYWATDEVRTYYQNNGQPHRVNQSAYEFIGTDLSFRFTAYTKAPLLFQKLRSTIGHDPFIAGLKHFYENYKFSIATLPLLQQSFEESLGKSLDWFFLPWFDNPYLPKYDFSNVSYDSTQGTMRFTVIDQNEDSNNYVYSQQIPLMVLDIRSFGVLYSDQVWINGTTTLNLNLSAKITPGEVVLNYGSEVLVQLESATDAFKTYSGSTWLDGLERPDSSWLPFGEEDWIEWTYRVYYTDTSNQISSVDQSGILNCDISQMKRFKTMLEVETEWAWTPPHDLLAEYTGTITSNLDGEGHVAPYHLSLISLFVGQNFQFSEEWVDSLSSYVNIVSFGIENEGRSLNLQYASESENLSFIAEYNSDGILASLEIAFSPLYPVGREGPELHGKLTLDLRSSSFKNYWPVSVSLVELALIPFTGIVIVAYVVYFLKIRKTN